MHATGATAGLGLDSLFHGNAAFGLGAKSDIADGSLRGFEFRKCACEHMWSRPLHTGAERLPLRLSVLPSFQWRTSVGVEGICRANILTGCVGELQV